MPEMKIAGTSQAGSVVYATLIQLHTNNIALQTVAVCKRAACEINGDPIGGYVSPVAVVSCADPDFTDLHDAVADGQQIVINMTYEDTASVKPVRHFIWDYA